MEPPKNTISNRPFKIICWTVLAVAILTLCVFMVIKLGNRGKTASIISSNYIGYDFARAVTGENDTVSMLIKPGAEIHDFELTPEDIINIKNADLFIYVGGESEEWVEDLLASNEIPPGKVLRLMDIVEAKEEELSEGMEGHETHEPHESRDTHHESEVEYDEHIWTSPVNAIKLINAIKDKLSTIHPERRDVYKTNADSYIARLSDIDQKIRNVVANGNRKELIFGDRFPFRYFVDEYGLSYYAAFPGCSEQTEASSQTIAFLVDKAKADNIKTILKIELTSDKLAQAIAGEVGAQVLTLNAVHNISEEDFRNGVTYADIMEENIKVLQEALE
ncbi:zinc ABC transporter substrate-binding protein [Candidatus Saccharibacteria bacterium]|nr:zinc ABC transporter substrate-binding protein [Candidatus Saccharibacteria bacterium]